MAIANKGFKDLSMHLLCLLAQCNSNKNMLLPFNLFLASYSSGLKLASPNQRASILRVAIVSRIEGLDLKNQIFQK